LGSLAEEIILLSQLENGDYPLPPEEVCLEETARQIISVYSHRAKEKEISILLEKTGEIPKQRLNSAGLKVSLSNIVENAVKYSAENSCVRVNLLSEGEKRVIFEVEDNGPGIPETEIVAIFDKFYRGENLKDKTKGTGLGLYITKILVEAMGGSLRVENRNGVGCCFKMEFKDTCETAHYIPR
jgi:signal transduction histidine kinase